MRMKSLGIGINARRVHGCRGLLARCTWRRPAGRRRDAVGSRCRSHAAPAKNDVNATQPDGTTALHWAVRQDDLETAQMLISAGARVTAATRYGVTPLYLAAAQRQCRR